MTTGIPIASLVAEIGVDGETAASAKLASFGAQVDETAAKQISSAERVAETVSASSAEQIAATQRVGTALRTSSAELGQWGVPFTNSLGTVGTALQKTSSQGSGALNALSKAGTVAAVGLAAAGVESLHLADSFDQADQRLDTAAENVGASMGTARGEISQTDDKLVSLGFSSSKTESAMAQLVPATKDVAVASKDVGLAADIARGRNIDLATATSILVKVETGHIALLGRLGINTKDATGHTIDATTALQRLTDAYGGQAAAYLDTYAGKTAVLGAEANTTAVSLGETEKDAIGHVAAAAYVGLQAFQGWNTATDGLLGKMTALTVGIGLAAVVGAKIITVAQSVGAAFTFQSAAQTAAAASAATTAAAEEAEALAAAQATAAEEALFAALTSTTASETEVAAAAATAATAQETLAAASATASAANVTSAGTSAGAAAGAGALATGSVTAAAAIGTIGTAYEGAKLDKGASQFGWLGTAVASTAKAFGSLVPGGLQAVDIIGGLTVGSKKHTDATKTDTAATSQAAQQQSILAAIQGAVSSAVGGTTQTVDALTGAYEGVAQSAANAASAMSQMNAAAFSGLHVQVDQHKATIDVNQAFAALKKHNQDLSGVGGGGGGGSHKSVAEAALDQAQKELTLRDALKSVADEGERVESAQHQLTSAESQAHDATVAESTAAKTLSQVLHGVAADTRAAQDASESYTKAQDDEKSSSLDVLDATAALSDAKKQAATDQAASAAAIKAAQAQLSGDQSSGADTATIAEDQKNLADVKAAAAATQATDNEKVERAEISLSEATLRHRDAVLAENEAQRIYKGTLDGFPKSSNEAKAAEADLTQAHLAAVSAADQVGSALRGVRDAQDSVADSALGLRHAQADLNGELNSSAGAGGGPAKAAAALDTFQTKLDAAALAAAAEAQATGAAIQASSHSVAQGMIAEVDSLKSLVDTEPILAAALDPVIAQVEAQLHRIATVEFIGDVPVATDTPAGRAAANRAHPHGSQNVLARAAGGTVYPGQTTTLGEEGMELGRLRPDGSGFDVLSAPQTRHVLGGGGGTDALLSEIRGLRADLKRQSGLTIENINVADVNDLIRQLDARDRRQYLLSSITN